MERPSDLARLEDDPEDALRRWGEKIVFDEAQRLPSLFPVLRSHVDEAGGRKGRVVLLGSASFGLARDISESLAGRVGFLDMAPFHVREVGGDWETLWIRGGFPGAYLRGAEQVAEDANAMRERESGTGSPPRRGAIPTRRDPARGHLTLSSGALTPGLDSRKRSAYCGSR